MPNQWRITAWADDCHPDDSATFHLHDGRTFCRVWIGICHSTAMADGFVVHTFDQLAAAHPQLRPVGVDNVGALLADHQRLVDEVERLRLRDEVRRLRAMVRPDKDGAEEGMLPQ